MKLAIIKAIIGWLWRNHKYLLVERVVPEGSHIQRHKVKKEKPCPVCGVEGGRCAC